MAITLENIAGDQDRSEVSSIHDSIENEEEEKIRRVNVNSKRKCETSTVEIWTEYMEIIKLRVLQGLIHLSTLSTKYPFIVIIFCVFVSVFSMTYGIMTNFSVETDESVLWSPIGSITTLHKEWVTNEAGFPEGSDGIRVLMHANGDNVLTVKAFNKLFDMIDFVRNHDDYAKLCQQDQCRIISASGFFNHDRPHFDEFVETDEDVKKVLSSFLYPDGRIVNRDLIFGDPSPHVGVNDIQNFVLTHSLVKRAKINDQANRDKISDVINPNLLDEAQRKFALESSKSLLILFELPRTNESYAFEEAMIDKLIALNDEWSNDNDFNISVNCRTCAADEFLRGIIKDAPLMAVAFFVMTLFCIISLSSRHRVQSRGLLGIGAVFTITLSIMTGYGLLFWLGTPLTPLTALFPYVMLGIGLDDTFILTDAFERSDPKKRSQERVIDVMNSVGMSITLSTLTTVFTYFLGCTAITAGIKWFCLYAAITIAVDFFYQITFFIALIVLDERRIKQNRFDFFICCKANENLTIPTQWSKKTVKKKGLMERYSDILLLPHVKITVLFCFGFLFVGGAYIASGIETAIDGIAIYPQGSFVASYFSDIFSFASSLTTPHAGVYFRDVDVSDESVRSNMTAYVDNLLDISYVSSSPMFFWLRDFEMFVKANSSLPEMSFNEQLDVFLNTKPFSDLYTDDIVRDAMGNVTASRTFITFDKLELFDIKSEVLAFDQQRQITSNFALNEDTLNSKFFTYSGNYISWELWSLINKEIAITVGYGLLSLFLITLIFVPHPFAAFVLVPTVFAVFIECIAFFRIAGYVLFSSSH